MVLPTTSGFHANISALGHAQMRARQFVRGPIMTLDEPLVFAEDKSSELESGETIHKTARAAFPQTESGEGELSAENVGNLLRRVSRTSMGEIDNLIGELQTLRRKLQSDGDRIQRDVAKYEGLNQQVMQLTKIISGSVRKLPGA
jgi:hypothetical protein